MKKFLKLLFVFSFMIGTGFFVGNTYAEAKQTSYNLNPKKVYTYGSYDIKGKKIVGTFTSKVEKDAGYYAIYDPEIDPYYQMYPILRYKETKKGLINAVTRSSEYHYYALKYPVKKGKSWKDGDLKVKIIDTNKKVKVKAGTYKKVVVVKYYWSKNDYEIEYYAPNVGMILRKNCNEYTNYKEVKCLELVKLKNK